MASCKVFIFSALLAVFLCSEVSSDAAENQICSDLKEARKICVGTSKLVECVNIRENWYAVELANCGEGFRCDESVPGCSIESVSTTKSTTQGTSPSTASSTSQGTSTTSTTAKPNECNAQDFKVDANDCSNYWYCVNGSWVPAKCPTGYFDPDHKSCTLVKKC